MVQFLQFLEYFKKLGNKMKITKTAIFSILMTMNFAFAFSETSTTFENNEFSKICKSLSKNKIIKGDFELIQKSQKASKQINSSGKYTISCDDGIIWFTEKPIQSVMVVTKTYIIQENKGKVRKTDGSKNSTFTNIAQIISSLFTGNYEEITKNFQIDFFPELENEQNWNAMLTPKDKTIATYMQKISVGGTFANNFATIALIELIQNNGDSSMYVLKNQVVTDNLTSNEAKYFEK